MHITTRHTRLATCPAPPTLQTLAQQGRWGRRFRLPGRRNQFFTPRQRGDGLARLLVVGQTRAGLGGALEISGGCKVLTNNQQLTTNQAVPALTLGAIWKSWRVKKG